jgi:apolipoprotein N-acyltransferase
MSRLEGIAQSVDMLRGWRKAGLLLLAGAVAGLAMPPFDLWPLLFLAFPILIWSLAQLSRRQAFAYGWLFGLGYFITCFYWIGIAFLVDAKTYLWMMPFMVGGLAGGMALYWGLAALVTAMLRQQGLSRIITFAVLLAIAEWLRGHLLTGFPWTAPGLAVDGMGGFAQSASLFGMPSLTLLIVLWAALPALLGLPSVRRREWTTALLILAVLPALWLWGSYRLASDDGKTVDGVTLRIVQPNVAQEAKWRPERERENFDRLKRLSMQATGERRKALCPSSSMSMRKPSPSSPRCCRSRPRSSWAPCGVTVRPRASASTTAFLPSTVMRVSLRITTNGASCPVANSCPSKRSSSRSAFARW